MQDLRLGGALAGCLGKPHPSGVQGESRWGSGKPLKMLSLRLKEAAFERKIVHFSERTCIHLA